MIVLQEKVIWYAISIFPGLIKHNLLELTNENIKLVTFAISCWHRSKKCGMMRYPDRCQGKSPCAVGEHVQNLQPWFQQLLIIFDIYSTKTVQRHEMCPFEPTQAQPQSQKGLDKTQTKNRIWWSEQQKTGRVVVCSWITCLERATVSRLFGNS